MFKEIKFVRIPFRSPKIDYCKILNIPIEDFPLLIDVVNAFLNEHGIHSTIHKAVKKVVKKTEEGPVSGVKKERGR